MVRMEYTFRMKPALTDSFSKLEPEPDPVCSEGTAIFANMFFYPCIPIWPNWLEEGLKLGSLIKLLRLLWLFENGLG